MPRARPQRERQLWSGGTESSSSESEVRYSFDRESESTDPSDMDDLDFMPDTEHEAMEKSDASFEGYEFKLRESVWVKPRGCLEWFRGTIVKVRDQTKDITKRGKLYRVVFRRHFTNMRDVFSSVEGNIMPDTPRVRTLLDKPFEADRTSRGVSRSPSRRTRRCPRRRHSEELETANSDR